MSIPCLDFRYLQLGVFLAKHVDEIQGVVEDYKALFPKDADEMKTLNLFEIRLKEGKAALTHYENGNWFGLAHYLRSELPKMAGDVNESIQMLYDPDPPSHGLIVELIEEERREIAEVESFLCFIQGILTPSGASRHA